MAHQVYPAVYLIFGIAEGSIAHTQDTELGGHAFEIQADAVEIGVGGALSEG